MDAITDTYERVKGLITTGEPAEALRLLEIELDDRVDPVLLALQGIAQHALGKYAAGAKSLESAAQLAPLSPSSQLALGDCYLFTNRHELARATYSGLADLPRIPFPLLSGLALGLSRVQEFERALAVCQQAAAARPECHHALYAVAYYMSKSGRPPEFVYPVLEQAIEMAPQVFCYRVAAATILSRMQETERAYLAIADATLDELSTVSCRCCLERLIALYETASDRVRAARCTTLLATARNECRRS